ncbi:putative apyrase 2, partial [Bienertia sinuspersici]
MKPLKNSRHQRENKAKEATTMVEIMATNSEERIESLIYTITFIPLFLQTPFRFFEPFSVIGEIGLRHLEFLSEIIPALFTVVDDDTSIAIQGLHASMLDDSFESAWEWILKFKEKIYSVAFESGSDGRRLLALKFVAAIILIYTLDPNGGTESPPHLIGDATGKEVGFRISWL